MSTSRERSANYKKKGKKALKSVVWADEVGEELVGGCSDEGDRSLPAQGSIDGGSRCLPAQGMKRMHIEVSINGRLRRNHRNRPIQGANRSGGPGIEQTVRFSIGEREREVQGALMEGLSFKLLNRSDATDEEDDSNVQRSQNKGAVILHVNGWGSSIESGKGVNVGHREGRLGMRSDSPPPGRGGKAM